MQQLNKEYEALAEIPEPDDEQQARLDAITERVEELDNRPTVWPPETLAIAGAVVTLDRDGEANVHDGLVKPEDAAEKAAKRKTGAGAGRADVAFSAALMEQPMVALAVTVHALAWRVFYNCAREDIALQIVANPPSLHRVESSPASDAIEASEERWIEQIPAEAVSNSAYRLSSLPVESGEFARVLRNGIARFREPRHGGTGGTVATAAPLSMTDFGSPAAASGLRPGAAAVTPKSYDSGAQLRRLTCLSPPPPWGSLKPRRQSMTKTPKLTEADLRQFTDSAHWYKHVLNPNVRFSDGTKYVADEGNAYWLLDLIAHAQIHDKRVSRKPFQVWALAVRPDKSGTVTVEDGKGKRLRRYAVEFTDFPVVGVTLWVAHGFISLPSEDWRTQP